MKIHIYKNFEEYADNKIENGIFYLDYTKEYVVVVLVENYDSDKFVELEESSKFHSEDMVIYDEPGYVRFQLIFESLEDAKDFIKQTKRRNQEIEKGSKSE